MTADDAENLTIEPLGDAPVGRMTLTSINGIELVIDADTNSSGNSSHTRGMKRSGNGDIKSSHADFRSALESVASLAQRDNSNK